MSSVSSSFAAVPRRQYIAVDPFYKNIFQYSTYIDPTLATRGRLVVHVDANLGNTGPGSILRENGKKLHSGTHPDLVDPNTSLPYTYLVGVYDVVSGLSGFINPNASFFSVMNSDKSYQDDNAQYQVDASMSNTTVPGNNYSNTGNQILGPSVLTAGTITTTGFSEASEMHAEVLFHTPGYLVAGPSSLIVNGSNVEITYGAGTILANSNITTNANVYASNGTVYGSNVTAKSNLTSGKMFITPVASGGGTSGAPLTVSAGTAQLDSGSSSKIIYTTALTGNSLIFATINNAGARAVSVDPHPSASPPYFVVQSGTASDDSTFYWMLVN